MFFFPTRYIPCNERHRETSETGVEKIPRGKQSRLLAYIFEAWRLRRRSTPLSSVLHVSVPPTFRVRVYVGRARISSFLGNHGPEVARKIISPKTGYTRLDTCMQVERRVVANGYSASSGGEEGPRQFNKFCRTRRRNPRRIPMEFRTMRWGRGIFSPFLNVERLLNPLRILQYFIYIYMYFVLMLILIFLYILI